MRHTSRGSVRLITRIACLLLIATPIAANAMGLGRFVVHSGLDEPLNGQIELISPTNHELKTLKTALASQAEFDIAGIERAAHLFNIKFGVSRSPAGQYYIKLTTDRAVREPFLHFLVQVEWSGGRLIREYSALLDPPNWVAGKPADIDVPNETVVGQTTGPTMVEPASPAPAEPVPTGSAAEVAPVSAEGGVPAEASAAPAPDAAPVETLPPLDGAVEPTAAAAEPTVLPLGASETPAATTPAATTAAAPEAAPAPISESSAAVPPAAAPIATTEPAPTQVMGEAVPAPAPAESAAHAEPTPAPRAPVAAKADVETPAVAGAQEYGPIRKGETLSEVTRKLDYDRSLTSQQVMIALLHANPAAFFDNNVNNLKAGKILRVPERETVAAIPRDQAAREFRGQYDAWQEYKLKLAGASRPVAVAEAEKAPEQEKPVKKPASDSKAPPAKSEMSEPAKDTKQGAAKEKTTGAKAKPVDLLKIVRANLEQDIPEDAAKTPGVETRKDTKDQKVLQDRVATLEEAIESKQIQNKEMREKVGKLQEQVKNTDRLIDLESKDLAKSQKAAAEKQAADEKAAQEKAAQEKAAQEKAAQEKAAQEKAGKDKDAAAPAKPAAAPKKPTPAAKPPVEEGILDVALASLQENLQMVALLAIVLFGGAGGLYAYRRKRASREFSESILSAHSSLSNEAGLSETSGQAGASDTSFLSDFSQGGMGNIHTDEVDPIAEAEVYLAYGRDEQAEEILKDAIVKDPARQELKGKLLEIYFQRNDVSGFETLAEELYAALEGRGGKVWEKAEEMGRKLSPSNPMFRGGKPGNRPEARGALSAAEAAATVGGGTTLLMSEPAHAAEPPGAMSHGLDMSADQGLDFNSPSLDFNAAATSESVPSSDFHLDFDAAPAKTADAGALDMSLDFTPGAPEPVDSASATDFSLDFNMGATAPASADTSSGSMDFSLSEATSGGDGGGGLDFDMVPSSADDHAIDFSSGGLDMGAEHLEASAASETAVAEAGLPGWDETATKLDLAKAYIDMGDSEGARSILDEVIAEGNDQQKRQAKELVSQIAA